MKTLTRAYGFSDVVQRPHNEDSHCIHATPRRQLYAVADGMNGLESASILKALQEHPALDSLTPDNYTRHLTQVIAELNTAIYTEHNGGGTIPAEQRKACTLSMLILCKDKAYLAHVGDSRVYHYAGEQLTRLTEDHSILQQLLNRGDILEKDVRDHPRRQQLYAAVGYAETLAASEIQMLDAVAGSTYLLCTDGITQTLSDGEIQRVLQQYPGEASCDQAITELQHLTQRHGEDNATAIGVYLPPA